MTEKEKEIAHKKARKAKAEKCMFIYHYERAIVYPPDLTPKELKFLQEEFRSKVKEWVKIGNDRIGTQISLF